MYFFHCHIIIIISKFVIYKFYEKYICLLDIPAEIDFFYLSIIKWCLLSKHLLLLKIHWQKMKLQYSEYVFQFTQDKTYR